MVTQTPDDPVDTDTQGIAILGKQSTDNTLQLISSDLPLNPLNISMGKISGYNVISKFGKNPDIDLADGFEDIFAAGQNLTFMTSAKIASVTSTSTADTLTGTGARTLTIQGLDSSWNEVEATVNMNGTETVSTTQTFLRIYRAFVVTVGSGGVNAGDITISVDTDGTQAFILANEGQTQQAIYTIPDGKTGYLYSGFVSRADSNKLVTAQLFIRKPNESWRLIHETQFVGGHTDVDLSGSSSIPEHSDIKWQADSDSNNTIVSAGFKIILEDN